MRDYTIYTDSACDTPAEVLKSWGVKSADLTFHFNGETVQYDNDAIPPKDFYEYMWQGKTAQTAAINIETFKDRFRREAEAGKDVLIWAFPPA